MRRRLLAGCLALAVSLAVWPGSSQAEMLIAVENENGRGQVDHYEVFDVVCGRPVGTLALAGKTSGTVAACGGLGVLGYLRIRYDGAIEWTDFPQLHSWSQIVLPERPRNRRLRAPSDD